MSFYTARGNPKEAAMASGGRSVCADYSDYRQRNGALVKMGKAKTDKFRAISRAFAHKINPLPAKSPPFLARLIDWASQAYRHRADFW